jgi:hypothetical protein
MRSLVEDEPKRIEIEIEPNATSLTLLQQVYRNPSLPLPTRMRAAGMALPHEHPKLGVSVTVNASDFADQLDRAVERSRKISPMIEAKPTETANGPSDSRRPHVQASNGGGKPPTIIDRRFRRW